MQVKIYKTNGCPWCEKTIKYLKSRGVEVEILNCSENEVYKYQLIRDSHQTSVPVIVVDDNVIIGFDKKRIDEVLK